jgi:hypothetical protein
MSYVQLDIETAISQARTEQLAGTQRAIDHADAVHEKWSERAYKLLIEYLQEKKRFMGEDVRAYAAEKGFDLPPSARAWGGVIQRAAKEYVIIKIGIGTVKNPKAHLANAAIWERNDERMIEMGLLNVKK